MNSVHAGKFYVYVGKFCVKKKKNFTGMNSSQNLLACTVHADKFFFFFTKLHAGFFFLQNLPA